MRSKFYVSGLRYTFISRLSISPIRGGGARGGPYWTYVLSECQKQRRLRGGLVRVSLVEVKEGTVSSYALRAMFSVGETVRRDGGRESVIYAGVGRGIVLTMLMGGYGRRRVVSGGWKGQLSAVGKRGKSLRSSGTLRGVYSLTQYATSIWGRRFTSEIVNE